MTAPHPADHPPDSLTGTSYDVIVLGGGSTGENVADYAVRGGLTAVVVEAELVGGDCSYWACMPSKALLRPVEALTDARGLAGSREAVTGSLDAAAVLARRDSFTSGWDDGGQVKWLDSTGISLVRGTGRLISERTVEVTGQAGDTVVLTARHAVVVCTGSAALIPPIDGLAAAQPWTSREATSAKAVPRRLAILGGGVVGVEMATAWKALGAQEVTLFERGERVLSTMEPEVGQRVGAALRGLGIDLRTEVAVTAVHRATPGGPLTITAGGRQIEADALLVAVGRTPRTDDLGLASIGLEPGSWLEVDDTLQVSAVDGGWLYAAGDVNHRALLTHQGKYQARAAGTVIAARANGGVDAVPWSSVTATADGRCVPQVVFSAPQAASVGLTEARAVQAGLVVQTATYELGQVAGAALYADGYDGWAKLVVDTERQVLVGATFVGAGVAELIHSATVAVVGEVPLARLWHAVPSYPTLSEVWLRLLDQLPHD